ncbi:hypothetical protein D3C77_255730 [compost metagenome]
MLGDRVDNVTVEIHKEDVAVVGLAHHVGVAAVKALVHPAIHLVCQDQGADGGLDLHLAVRLLQLVPGAGHIAGLGAGAGLLGRGAELFEGPGETVEATDTVAGKVLLGEVDDLLFEVAEVVFQLALLDVAHRDQMVGSLGGEVLAVAVEEKQGDDQEGHQAQHEESQHQLRSEPTRPEDPFHGVNFN